MGSKEVLTTYLRKKVHMMKIKANIYSNTTLTSKVIEITKSNYDDNDNYDDEKEKKKINT